MGAVVERRTQMRWTRQVSSAVLVTAAFAACARFTVHSDYDHAASFQALRTYDWRPGPQRSIGDPRVDDALVDSTVRGAVDRELAARGYTKGASATPDFLVAYQVGVGDKSDTVTIGERYTSGGVWSTASWYSDTSQYEEGMLSLGIIDSRTTKLMWRGIAKGIVDPTASPEEREKRIIAAVRKLLKEFAPQ